MDASPQMADFAALDHQLSTIASRLQRLPEIFAAMRELVEISGSLTPDACAFLRSHPVFARCQHDPFTAHSMSRPRGYAGDAALIDLIYETGDARQRVAAASEYGKALYSYSISRPSAEAVRERRRILAALVAVTTGRNPTAEVLALAAGHLREADLLTAEQFPARWLALDQDPLSVAEIQRCHTPRVTTVTTSVGRFMVRPLMNGHFDLIYAAGLYDYLDEPTAIRLTQGAFSALKPGGELLLANFTHDCPDAAYMDVFMDWRLIARDEAELHRIIAALPQDDVARTTLFRGNNRVIAYAVVERRG